LFEMTTLTLRRPRVDEEEEFLRARTLGTTACW
jgi:hypothetical protein